jgi:hypothetical protein
LAGDLLSLPGQGAQSIDRSSHQWEIYTMTLPNNDGWTEQITFAILDALLTRHHQVTTNGHVRSISTISQKYLRQIEAQLASRVKKARR